MLPPVLLRSCHLPPLYLMQKRLFFPFLLTPWASLSRVISHQGCSGRTMGSESRAGGTYANFWKLSLP